MNKANFLLCLWAIAICSVIGSPTDDGRIVNGLQITKKQAPYMVRVLLNGATHGSGSLVAPSYVVTAAHLVYKKSKSSITIVADVSTTDEAGIRRKVSSWSIHKDYKNETMHTDIVVIKLKTPIDNIVTLKLCKQPLKEGDSIQVSGWGSRVKGEPGSRSLRSVVLPVRSKQSCKDEYHRFVKKNMFCASGLDDKGTCHGDSGGPAVFKGQLCGIVAFAFGCGEIGSQNVFTDCYAMKSFIEDSIAAGTGTKKCASCVIS